MRLLGQFDKLVFPVLNILLQTNKKGEYLAPLFLDTLSAL
jgi:hypothetical protein